MSCPKTDLLDEYGAGLGNLIHRLRSQIVDVEEAELRIRGGRIEQRHHPGKPWRSPYWSQPSLEVQSELLAMARKVPALLEELEQRAKPDREER